MYIGDKVTQSGPDGHYIIYDVPPGTYSLSMANAERLGFLLRPSEVFREALPLKKNSILTILISS